MIDGDDDGPWTVRTLKAYFERIICDLNRRISTNENSIQNGRNKEVSFYSREQHDDFAKGVSDQMDRIRAEIESLRRPQWSLWMAAMTLLMSIVGTLWYLSVQPLKEEMSHLSDKDAAFAEQLKLTNDRIDRLYDLYRDLQRQHFEKFDGPSPPQIPQSPVPNKKAP